MFIDGNISMSWQLATIATQVTKHNKTRSYFNEGIELLINRINSGNTGIFPTFIFQHFGNVYVNYFIVRIILKERGFRS